MKICVCVKIVPRDAVKLRIDPDTGRLDRTGATDINAADQYAIEEALRIRDRDGAEVVMVSMGPQDGAESLRPGLAMGADRAVLVSDALLEGSDLVVTSRVLATVLAREKPELTIFGSQATDGGGAMLWAAVAERLSMPLLSGIRDIELIDARARAVRQLLDGDVVLEAPLPCVAALSGYVNTPRYPTFRDVLAAKRKEITTVSVASLGLASRDCGTDGSGTRVLGLSAPPPRRAAGQVVRDEGNAAQWLLGYLTERGIV